MEKLASFVELEVLTHHHLAPLLRVYDETLWWKCGRENDTLTVAGMEREYKKEKWYPNPF